MNIRFREYKEDDISDLEHLMIELGYSVERNELESNVKEIINRGGQVIVAEDNRKVIGSVCIILDARLAEGVYAEIVSLVVDSKARGKGVGKALVKIAEDWASGRVRKIRVRVNEIRIDAHLFYESLGYKLIKCQKMYKKWCN